MYTEVSVRARSRNINTSRVEWTWDGRTDDAGFLDEVLDRLEVLPIPVPVFVVLIVYSMHVAWWSATPHIHPLNTQHSALTNLNSYNGPINPIHQLPSPPSLNLKEATHQ